MNDWEVLVVGIVEDNKERTSFIMLKDMLQSAGYIVHYINSTGSLAIFKAEDKEILTIDIKADMIGAIRSLDIEFDIFIHNFINLSKDHEKKLKEIFKSSNTIILNCDVDNWNNLIEDNEKSVVISYGFNNKAAINLSSYNIDDSRKANICFQRGLKTINGETIEPFELPIIIRSEKKDDIYSAMAVLACGLLTSRNHHHLLKDETLEL